MEQLSTVNRYRHKNLELPFHKQFHQIKAGALTKTFEAASASTHPFICTFPPTKQIPISHQTKHSVPSATTSESLNPQGEQRRRRLAGWLLYLVRCKSIKKLLEWRGAVVRPLKSSEL